MIRQCIHQQSQSRRWLARTLLALRQKEGSWIGALVRNSKGSFDLGPMQVNDWWAPKIAILIDRDAITVRTWLTHDPCFNVWAAKWIFHSALVQSKDYWQSIGICHCPTRWRQTTHAQDVAKLLKLMPRSYGVAAAGLNMSIAGNGRSPSLPELAGIIAYLSVWDDDSSIRKDTANMKSLCANDQSPISRPVRSVMRVSSDGRPSRRAKPGHSAVPLLT